MGVGVGVSVYMMLISKDVHVALAGHDLATARRPCEWRARRFV